MNVLTGRVALGRHPPSAEVVIFANYANEAIAEKCLSPYFRAYIGA